MRYNINRNLVIRREYFGGVIIDVESPRSSYFIIDNKTIDLLELILSGMPYKEIVFNMRKIYSDIDLQEIKEIIDEALNNHIITPSTNSYEDHNIFNFQDFLLRRNKSLNIYRLSAPITVSLNLTFKCNQMCDFCYVNKEWKKDYQYDLDLNFWKSVVDQIVDCKIPFIDIFGGEPFIYPGMIDLLEYINSKPINCIISTNGTLITEEISRRLGKLNKKKLYVGVSIEDSEERLHDAVVKKEGAYRLALRGIKHLIANDVNFGIGVVVSKRNASRIPALYEKVSELGVPQFTLSFFHAEYNYLPDTPNELTVEEFHSIYQDIMRLNESKNKKIRISEEGPFLWLYPKKNDLSMRLYEDGMDRLHPTDPFGIAFSECQLGKSRLDIFPDGSVFPCVLLGGREEFNLGNLKNNTLYEIWDGKKMEELYHLIPIKEEPCNDCKFIDLCKGGCFAYMLNRYGVRGKPDVRCPIVNRYYNV